MSKRTGLICFLLLAALFLLLNRAAYKGYYTDDDFDHLSWTRNAPVTEFLKGLLTPRFQTNNFRPAGHLFYHLEERLFGFDFPKYVAAIHVLHLFNVWLLWLLIRRLGAQVLPAAAACVFFALHMGFFEAVWKPAYIFDVLCTTFCLLSFLCYSGADSGPVRGRHPHSPEFAEAHKQSPAPFRISARWILAFLFFWLAYKSKEPAVMLPFVLACYEYWFGAKSWKPLLPFFIVSLSFGLQGLLLNPNHGNAYAFQFTPGALQQTAVYYAGRVFLLPYLGFALAAAALLANRRVWLGLAAMLLLFVPVLFLPGRIETAYCYLPFVGLAIAFAGIAESTRPAVIAVFLLLWFPLDIRELRAQRRDKLARDDDARAWVATWNRYAAARQALTPVPPDAVILSGAPFAFGLFGMEGAIKCTYRQGGLDMRYTDRPALPPDRARVAFLTWNSSLHKLDIVEHTPSTSDASYIDTTAATPIWQLQEGWYGPENGFRWIAPAAAASLERPAAAARFELRVLASTTLLEKAGPVTLRVLIGDRQLEPRRFTEPGWQTATWQLPPGPACATRVAIQTEPPFQPVGDPRILGIAVGSFGFR